MPGHWPARNPAGRPGGLKIKTAGDAVNVKQFAGKIQSGANPAFHRLEIHLAQTHAAAGDEFILVQALARHLKFRADELLDEFVLRRAQPRRAGTVSPPVGNPRLWRDGGISLWRNPRPAGKSGNTHRPAGHADRRAREKFERNAGDE